MQGHGHRSKKFLGMDINTAVFMLRTPAVSVSVTASLTITIPSRFWGLIGGVAREESPGKIIMVDSGGVPHVIVWSRPKAERTGQDVTMQQHQTRDGVQDENESRGRSPADHVGRCGCHAEGGGES